MGGERGTRNHGNGVEVEGSKVEGDGGEKGEGLEEKRSLSSKCNESGRGEGEGGAD